MIRFFLLTLLLAKSIHSTAPTTDELKEELLQIREEIGLLKAENKNQSVQIAVLKEIFDLQNKTIDQKIAKEIKKRIKDCVKTGDGNGTRMISYRKQLPIRKIPILVNELSGCNSNDDNTKDCHLLATVIYDAVLKKSKISEPTNCSEKKPFRKCPVHIDELIEAGGLNKNDSTKNYYRLIPEMIYDKAVSNKSITIPTDTNSNIKTPRKFYGQPANCSDLFDLGHTLNGFYTVKPAYGNSDNVKLETIFCAFNQPEGVAFNASAVENRIANLSRVSSNVAAVDAGIHFHAQKHIKTKFQNNIDPKNAFVPFDEVFLNMGEAFDKKHTFIAPKSGVYQFVSTLAMASIPESNTTTVTLCLNGLSNVVGKSSTNNAGSTLAIEATLKLKQGDKIYLSTFLGGGFQIEWASFSGSLLEAV